MDETERLLPQTERVQMEKYDRTMSYLQRMTKVALGIGILFICCIIGTRSYLVNDVSIDEKIRVESSQLDLVHASFPLDCSFRQYTLSADDDGYAYVSGDGRSFRSDHSNLFGRGVTGKIVSVDGNAFLIRSNGECCRFMNPGDEILLRPTTFSNYRSAGSTLFDMATATLWVDPAQASMFWLDSTGLPLRWDYIPKSPTGRRITEGKMVSMVFSNFTLAPQDRTLFDVPAICTTAQRCRFD